MLHLEKYLICILLISFVRISSGQCTVTLQGSVLDTHHDEGLEFATVFIEELNIGRAADEKGNFIFEDLCPGQYHLLISHMGCQSIRKYLEIKVDTLINFQLEHHSFLLDEVDIIATNGKYGLSLNQYNISGQLLESLQGKDLGQIVATTPGVNTLVSGYTISKPMINGMTGNRIALLNHGVPLESQQWGNDHAPEIDPFAAEAITVIKGSAAVKYGINAMGGVIVTSSLPISDDPHPHFNINSMYHTNGRKWIENIGMEGSSKLAKYRIVGTYKKSGDLSTPNYLLANTGSREFHFAATLTNQPSSKWYRSLRTSMYSTTLGILRGAHIGNTTDLKEAITRKIPFFTSDTFKYAIAAPSQQVRHFTAHSENKITLAGGQIISIEAAIQQNIRREYDVRRGNLSNRPVMDLDLRSIWTDVAYTKIKDNSKIQFGFQNKYVNNKNIQGTGVIPILPNYVQNNLAFYGLMNKNYINISAEASARLEYQYLNSIAAINDNGNGVNQAYTVGLNYNHNNLFISKLNIGYINRKPFVNELYSNGLHQGLAAIEEGNPDLLDEQSLKFTLENKWRISSHINLIASTFYHRFDNYIFLVPDQELRLTIRGAFPVFQYNQLDATLFGGDAMITMEANHQLELIGKVSYIRGSDKSGLPLVFMPPLSGTLGVNYLFNKLGFANDVKFTSEFQHVAMQSRLVIEQDYAPAPNSYTLVNSGISAKIKLFKHDAKFDFGVENIFNTQYRNYLNRFRYFADELGRNITLKINLNL